MRTFALALLAAVAAAAAAEATGPAVNSNLTSKINLEAATKTKTTTVTVGGSVTFAAAATADEDDTAELTLCYATETDKKFFCALATFEQINNANGDAQTAKITPRAFSSTSKPVAGDFTAAQLYSGGGTDNFDATKFTQVATPDVSDTMTVTSTNATPAAFSGTATGTEKDSWTFTNAATICSSKTECSFKATRAVAAADSKAAVAELEAIRTFSKTTVAAAAFRTP